MQVKQLFELLSGEIIVHNDSKMMVTDDDQCLVSLEDKRYSIGETVDLGPYDEVEICDHSYIKITEDENTKISKEQFSYCDAGDVIIYDNCKMMVLDSIWYVMSLEDVDKHYIGELVSIKSNDEVSVCKGAIVEVARYD